MPTPPAPSRSFYARARDTIVWALVGLVFATPVGTVVGSFYGTWQGLLYDNPSALAPAVVEFSVGGGAAGAAIGALARLHESNRPAAPPSKAITNSTQTRRRRDVLPDALQARLESLPWDGEQGGPQDPSRN